MIKGLSPKRLTFIRYQREQLFSSEATIFMRRPLASWCFFVSTAFSLNKPREAKKGRKTNGCCINIVFSTKNIGCLWPLIKAGFSVIEPLRVVRNVYNCDSQGGNRDDGLHIG